MWGDKYTRFVNIGLFIPLILLSFIGDYYSSLHFIICMVLYLCLLCWIQVRVVHLNLKFSFWYSGVFCYLTLKLMWDLSHWVASILFSMAIFHVVGKLDLTILVSNSKAIQVIENVICENVCFLIRLCACFWRCFLKGQHHFKLCLPSYGCEAWRDVLDYHQQHASDCWQKCV
jgi:hypothetical protein